jgi:hypothetical protein
MEETAVGHVGAGQITTEGIEGEMERGSKLRETRKSTLCKQ